MCGCQIEKRLYHKGYHVEWVKPIKRNTNALKSNYLKLIKLNAIKNDVSIQTLNITPKSEFVLNEKIDKRQIHSLENRSLMAVPLKTLNKKEFTKKQNLTEEKNGNVSAIMALVFGFVFPIVTSILSISGGWFSWPLLLTLIGFYTIGYFIATHTLKNEKLKGDFKKLGIPNIVFHIFQSFNYFAIFSGFLIFSAAFWFWGSYYTILEILPPFLILFPLSFLPIVGKKYAESERIRKFKEVSNREKLVWLFSLSAFLLTLGFSFIPYRFLFGGVFSEFFFGLVGVFLFAGSYFIQKLFEKEKLKNGSVSAYLNTTKNLFQIGLAVLSITFILFGIESILVYLKFNSIFQSPLSISIIGILFGLFSLLFETKWLLQSKALKQQ